MPPHVAQFPVCWSQPSVVPVHMLLAQHGWPMPPQVAQVLVIWSQPSVAPVQLSLAQQGCPMAPHGQTPFMHAPPPGHEAMQLPPCSLQQPLEQALPAQHGSPRPPQATHELLSQVRPEAMQVSLLQQG